MRRAFVLAALLASLALAWLWLALEFPLPGQPPASELAASTAALAPASGPALDTPAPHQTADLRDPPPASTEAAPTAAQEAPPGVPATHSAAEGKSSPVPLSRQQASERVRDRQRMEDCAEAAREISQERWLRRQETEWRWLPAAQAAQEQQALRAVAARVQARCNEQDLADAARGRLPDLAAASAAGEPQARLLHAMSSASDLQREQWQAMRYDLLLSGMVEAYPLLGQTLYQVRDPQAPPSRADLMPDAGLWQLVACDLGAPCGAGSRALDLMCLRRSSAACTAPDVESALRMLLPQWQFQLAQAARRELVARIRAGRIQGLLDPRGR